MFRFGANWMVVRRLLVFFLDSSFPLCASFDPLALMPLAGFPPRSPSQFCFVILPVLLPFQNS